MYLFVSAGFAQISGDHIEAAQVAGSGSWGVFFKVILPLLRPSLTYGGGVALLLGLGQFTAPLLLGRNGGIDVVTTDMYRAMANYPPQYGRAAEAGMNNFSAFTARSGLPDEDSTTCIPTEALR